MVITWHGNFTLKFVTHGLTVIIDPHSSETGLRPLQLKADIVALSNPSVPEMSHVKSLKGVPRTITSPGEYSFHSITLHASGWHDDDNREHSIQRWHIEGITLVHLGALTRKLEPVEIQEFEKTDIDILFIPIGDRRYLDIEQALDLISVIEPHVVIPIYYHTTGLKEKLDKVDRFAEEMGITPSDKQEKLSIASKDIDKEAISTILLKP